MHILITTRPTWLHHLGRSDMDFDKKKFLGCQTDQYLVMSGSPDRFIGRIWQLGDCLAAALLMISQHWCRWWLGAVRQQAITWANVDPVLCRHMASIGHNELMSIFTINDEPSHLHNGNSYTAKTAFLYPDGLLNISRYHIDYAW